MPQADRDEAARRLILRNTPEARQVLAAALGDANNRFAQIAAARAIALDPDPDQAFVNALFDLIGPRPDVTDAAIGALAAYRTQPDVVTRLTRLAVDPRREHRETTRASAIRAVGTMPNKDSARLLMGIVTGDNEPPAVRAAAGAALSDLTGSSVVRTDPAYWQKWWNETQTWDDGRFERELLEARGARLVRLQNRFERFVDEARAMLEELYQSAPEKNKESILLRYLRSAEPETKVLGAKLVASDFKQTRPVTPAVRDQLRAMVADSSSQVRVAVAQSLFLLNDAQAFDALLAQLAREPDAEVRIELAKALVPMRDARVVRPLVNLLRDPSLPVAEVAARGLGDPNLTPLIQKDVELSTIVATELRKALADRAAAPGATSLRAALIDAMGSLRNVNLHQVYVDALRPNANEPVAIRRAALRALGQYDRQQLAAATFIVDALLDPDESVRLEAVKALRGTADFAHAERLYGVLSRESHESSRAVRDEAWGVLRNLFADPNVTNGQLSAFADRFKGDPEKRIEVLKVLAERLTPKNDADSQRFLAATRENLGAEYMEQARRANADKNLDPAAREEKVIENAKQADSYFDNALQYYRSKDPTDQTMSTSNLLELRMDALLATKQYGAAADFAASSITANPGNQEAMGRKIHNEIDRLARAGQFEDALKLIEAAKAMKPPLADQIASSIERIEKEVRSRVQNEPRSAVGAGE